MYRSDSVVKQTVEYQKVLIVFTGLEKIQDWIKDSLKRRLNKSLSHDWIPEKRAHKFPLRQYYVQLEWKKKVRTAMGSETITLTSLNDLIKQLGLESSDNSSLEPATKKKKPNYPSIQASSIIVEGKIFRAPSWVGLRPPWGVREVHLYKLLTLYHSSKVIKTYVNIC